MQQQLGERSESYMWEILCRHQGLRWSRGRRWSRQWSRDSLQLMMKTVPWRSPLKQITTLKLQPWKASAAVGSWQETAACRKTFARTRFCCHNLRILFLKDSILREGPVLEPFLRKIPMEKFMKNNIPRVRPHAGVSKEHEENKAAKSYELTAAPISHPPALLAGRI